MKSYKRASAGVKKRKHGKQVHKGDINRCRKYNGLKCYYRLSITSLIGIICMYVCLVCLIISRTRLALPPFVFACFLCSLRVKRQNRNNWCPCNRIKLPKVLTESNQGPWCTLLGYHLCFFVAPQKKITVPMLPLSKKINRKFRLRSVHAESSLICPFDTFLEEQVGVREPRNHCFQ